MVSHEPVTVGSQYVDCVSVGYLVTGVQCGWGNAAGGLSPAKLSRERRAATTSTARALPVAFPVCGRHRLAAQHTHHLTLVTPVKPPSATAPVLVVILMYLPMRADGAAGGCSNARRVCEAKQAPARLVGAAGRPAVA